MRKIRGSAILDYVLPLALVGIVVGLGLNYGISNNVLGNFIAKSAGQKTESSNKIIIGEQADTTISIVSESKNKSEGFLNEPEVTCDSDKCSINYGSYVLEGLPANFNDFVQAHGTSGGTDTLADTMMLLAQQLEEKGYDNETIKKIKKMANLGHNIASLERKFESTINTCGSNNECLSNFLAAPSEAPADFDENYGNFPTDENNYMALYRSVTIGTAQQQYNENKAYYNKELARGLAGHEYIDTFNKIMEQDNLPNDVKGILQELTWQMGTMAEDFQNNVNLFNDPTIENGFCDPITGELSGITPPEGDTLKIFQNYDASQVTDLDSSLICASGYMPDSGKKCH